MPLQSRLKKIVDDLTVEGPVTFCILGGAGDTGNLGVSALGAATVKQLRGAFPESKIILQCFKQHAETHTTLAGELEPVELMCLHHSDRLRDRFGTRHLGILDGLARLAPGGVVEKLRGTNRTFEQLSRVDMVLDVSGGDSFADLYGPDVFMRQIAIKRLMMSMGKPMVLLPQTFGPFQYDVSRQEVRRIIGYCDLVATREAAGMVEIEALFDGRPPASVVQCPDMAFSLEPVAVAMEREPFIDAVREDETLIGLNVSGLLYCTDHDYGLGFDYRALIDSIARWALAKPGTRLLLVPHVISPTRVEDCIESADRCSEENQWDIPDPVACAHVLSDLEGAFAGRIDCVRGWYEASEMKYLIGQCDFFIGARMHACIGAVSQAVPTATLAYSKKAEGVLSMVGLGETVVDMRSESLSGCVERIEALYRGRHVVGQLMQEQLPGVKAGVESFFGAPRRAA